jgi:superoxide dismutase, Cu-Zn family
MKYFMVKKLIYIVVSLTLIMAFTGCSSAENLGEDKQMEGIETFNNLSVKAAENTNMEKKVDIINSAGKKVGMAVLTQLQKGVLLQVYATGLQPGRHGFHFHQTGKCDGPDFKSAGEHFNPTSKKHGFNNPEGYHAGDISNLVVNKKGVAEGEFFLETVTLVKGQPNSLQDQDGSALVIHSGADDYSTDPAGNAGDRVGCAVIAE